MRQANANRLQRQKEHERCSSGDGKAPFPAPFAVAGRHSPGMPLSSCEPRSSKVSPKPATRPPRSRRRAPHPAGRSVSHENRPHRPEPAEHTRQEHPRSRQESIARAGIARLSPAAVAEREQAERKEQQWQKENMPTTHHEHDHGNCKADRKRTHQRTPSNSAFPAKALRRPVRGGRRAPVRPLLRFALPHLAPPGACFLVAVLDQLLEPLEIAAHLTLDDAQEIARDVLRG